MVEAERVSQSESGGDVEYGEEEQLSLFIKEDIKGYKCCSMLGVSVRNVATIGRSKYTGAMILNIIFHVAITFDGTQF